MADAPQTGRANRVLIGLAVAAAVLFAADAFYKKKTYLSVEDWFGFYGLYGFAACAVLGLAAWALAPLLRRAPDYYDLAGDPDGDDAAPGDRDV
ncbi:MAG: hypothetical protein AAF631_10840 [Pseudomonadota bacterium]